MKHSKNLKKRLAALIMAIITLASSFAMVFASSTQRGLTKEFTVVRAGNGMKYGAFEPNLKEGQKYPLVIFVHGLSHGWTDAGFVKSGLTYWADDEIQAKFKEGGAYLLMPKIPEVVITATQHEKVFGVINEYVNNHPQIDRNQIYIMGASAGGALTWRIISDHPGYFKKAVPMCGIKWLTASEAKAIADTPVWMMSAKTDPLVWYFLFSRPNWNTLVRHSNVKDQLRHTVFNGRVQKPEGGYTFVSHQMQITIGHNLCLMDGDQPIKNMKTTDGYGNNIDISFENAIIEWLQSDIPDPQPEPVSEVFPNDVAETIN